MTEALNYHQQYYLDNKNKYIRPLTKCKNLYCDNLCSGGRCKECHNRNTRGSPSRRWKK